MPYEELRWSLRNTQLQYYLGIQKPELLSDENWANKIAELQYIRTVERNESMKQMNAMWGG